MKRRILSILMIFCMCMTRLLTMLPQGAAIVSAAEDKEWPGNPYKKNPNDRFTTFDCVYFGNYWYHDTDGDGNVNQSDGKEPIKWRVLSVDESGNAFLMADKIVDAKPYNKTEKSGVTWENCTLRSWLNGYDMEKNGEEDYSGAGNSFFDNAFSKEEKNAILETEVENGDDRTKEGTMDKVYLLSISEVTNPAYGFSASKSSDGSRVADSTKYAYSAFPWLTDYWYLRSMVDKGSSATPTATLIDDSYGTVEENIYGNSVARVIGVRPVLHLNLNKDVWVTACPVQGMNNVLHRSFGPWHSDPDWKDYHKHICTDETCVRLEPYNSSDRESCSGGRAGYTKRAICAVCGNEYGTLLTDNTPPTGKVSAGTDQWDDVISGATFELFFNESKDVTISAEDGESGVASISYYLTDRELTREDLIDIESWQPTEADYKEEDDWKPTDTVTVTIEPDTECILYAKIVDGVGNTTYLSSDGMVFDGTAPKIEGVEDKGTYCASQDVTVKVTDKYLDSVTLDGKNIGLTGSTCTFTISGEASRHTITAADKAGNHKTVTVTMNKDHIFGDWEENTGKNRSKTCENCGQKYTETDEERVKAAKDIVEEFLDGLSAAEDMGKEELQQKLEEKLAREGFSDVKVTVDEFHKEEASAQTEGSIQGHVTLELREASEGVDFDLPLDDDRQRVQRAREVIEKTLSEMSVSNDTAKEDVQNAVDQALKEAGLEDVTATVENDFTVKKATEESEGKITGTVALEKGKETDSIGIDRKINKLEQMPDSNDAQRLEAAKKVVQNVLDGMSATNDTTQEKIQKVIDEALKAAGFDDVTAAVGDDLTIRESTGDTKGKITGTVTLEKGEAKGTVEFDLEIPEDKSRGTVDKETQSGEGAPEAELPMEKEEMAAAVFTEKEWQEIGEGKDIKLLLTVDNIEEDKVSAEDAEEITKGASYYTVGQYLDINLLKTVSTNGVEEGEPTRITSTGKPIRVVIYIPDSLKGDGSKVRTYAVVRLHDGETTLLEDLDDDPDTLTIETDRFSTYAMVYTELTDEDRVAGAEEKLEEILKGLTATNDTTKEDMEKQIHDKLAEAGYGDVTVTVQFTEKDEATTEKEGSLKGTATISKGSASGQPMLWEATIEKVTETLPSASPSMEPTEAPQKTPGVTSSAAPTVTPDGNADDDKYQKVGLIPELKVIQKGKKIQVEWGKATDADGYLVYVQYCSKKFAKKATKTVRKSSTTKVKIAKVGGKKLKLKKNFKVYVAAYKMMDGKQVVIKKTMTGHIVGKKNYKSTNAKKVKVTKSKIILKTGETAKIKAKTVRVDRKKKLISKKHGKKYRYRSVDDSIVTVSKSGTITAVGKGNCSVYVFAQNGCAKKVRITVK